tara:strand:+ start:182 stop:367 length:186 start_codon:yes stop_codon:yes gene_type:complete
MYKLSHQAIGALMMTLQKCLADQSDISELLSDWTITEKDGELFVTNAPKVEAHQENVFETE